jgi:hypothetical protein
LAERNCWHCLTTNLYANHHTNIASTNCPYSFVSERGAPFTVAGLAKLVERAGIEAQIGFKVHPHMLRHACGYALANKGTDTRTLQAYLGHRSIQSTVRYTDLAPGRFGAKTILPARWCLPWLLSSLLPAPGVPRTVRSRGRRDCHAETPPYRFTIDPQVPLD